MPTYVSGEIIGRQLTNDGAKRVYFIEDAATEEDVVAWLDDNAPAEIAGFPFSGFDANESDEIENGWEVSVDWGQSDSGQSQESGTSGYRFSYQAPGAHVMQSLATIASFYDSALLPFGIGDGFGGAINVVWDEGKQRVEGQNVEPPAEVFTVPYTDIPAVITPAYQSTLRDLCGKVNSTTFYGYTAGQIMLVRAQGDNSKGLWNLEFGFAYIPNTTGEVYGEITGVAKDGMDLLWPYYLPTKDETAKELMKRPAAIFVERIWRRADLNALNLP